MKEYQLTEADIKQLQEWGFEPDEIRDADLRVYSFDDWVDTTRSMGFFTLGGWGIKAHYLTENGDSTTKGNGRLTLFILPESEAQKIEQCKREIVEGFVVAYFEALKNCFESRCANVVEKKIMVEKELKKVENLLFEHQEDYQFHSYGEGLWLNFYTYANRKAGSMCDWYERICIDGEEATRAVSSHHATMTANELNSNHPETLHFVVAALAFHRFKNYLKNKLDAAGIASEKEHSTRVPSKTLALWCFYRESKGEFPELEGMNRKEIAEKLAREHSLSPGNFRQDLSAMKKKDNRLVNANIPRIQQVIEMLSGYPKSLQYANDELKTLQSRNG